MNIYGSQTRSHHDESLMTGSNRGQLRSIPNYSHYPVVDSLFGQNLFRTGTINALIGYFPDPFKIDPFESDPFKIDPYERDPYEIDQSGTDPYESDTSPNRIKLVHMKAIHLNWT